jgi:tetratricopeptide (TPR) repeat protein
LLLRREAQVARSSGDFTTFVTAEHELSAAAAKAESKIERAISPAMVRRDLAETAGDFGAALEAGNAWLRLVPELGLPGIGALVRVAGALAGLGRNEEAIQKFREALRRDELRGTPAAFIGEHRQELARAQLGAGRIDEARESAERAYHEISDDDAFSRSTTAVALAMVRDAQGQVEEAGRLFRLAIDAAKGYQWLAVLARVAYARFLIGQRRAAEARAQLKVARVFYGHPFVARRHEVVEELRRRCDEVRA